MYCVKVVLTRGIKEWSQVVLTVHAAYGVQCPGDVFREVRSLDVGPRDEVRDQIRCSLPRCTSLIMVQLEWTQK